MEPKRFDHITRGLATQGTRRSLLRGLTGLGAGTLAAVGLGPSARFARALQTADSEEQSVLLYEEVAKIAHEHVGTCTDLSARLVQFGQDYADLFAAHKVEQDAWTRDKAVQHADFYGERRWEATTRLMAARARCGYAIPVIPEATPVGADRVRWTFTQQATPIVGSGEGGGDCTDTTTTACLYLVGSGRSSYYASTPTFSIAANCSDDGSGYCAPCIDNGPQFCSTNFPDLCTDATGTPICTVGSFSEPDCCHQQCPISTGDCALNWVGGLTTSDDCLRCRASWCGSTSNCLEHCESEACCAHEHC